MAELLTLPRLGETMESGRIVAWQKQPGDGFRRGETIVEVESDKTVVELPALVNGTLVEILAAEGDDIAVGAALCRYEREGVVQSAASATSQASPEPSAAHTNGTATVAISAEGTEPRDATALAADNATQRATPAARSLARKHAIDLRSVIGTGRRARVEKADILSRIDVFSPARQPAVPGVRSAPATPAPSGESARLSIDLPPGRLAYRQWRASVATRQTVVLLHGFGGESDAWSHLATLLTRNGLNVLAPDLPAHGETTIDAAAFSDVVEPIISFLSGLDTAVELVGHSLGGAVGVAAALVAPQSVTRLTLVAPAGLGSEIDGDFVTGMASVRNTGALAHLLRRIALRPAPLSRAQLEAMVETLGRPRLGPLAAALAADGRQQLDIVADLDRLSMPARVIWGLDDRIIPWTHVAHLPAHIPAHLIGAAGHMPYWDQPAKIAALFAPAPASI